MERDAGNLAELAGKLRRGVPHAPAARNLRDSVVPSRSSLPAAELSSLDRIFFYTLLRRLFRCEPVPSAIAALVLTALSLFFCYDPVEAFYWFNGGVYYTFFYLLGELLFALLLLSATASGKAPAALGFVLSVLLAFLIGGGNYPTALMSAVLLLLLLAFCVRKRRKREAAALLLVLAALLSSFLVSVFAPGNAVRQAAEGSPSSPVTAIFLALLYGVYAFCGAMSLPVVVGWAFLTPILYRAAARLRFSFPRPLAVFLLAFAVFCTQGAPVCYALGVRVLERVIDITYFSCYPLVLLTWTYFLGWLSHQSRWLAWWDRAAAGLPKPKPAALSLLALLCFCGSTLGLVRVAP